MMAAFAGGPLLAVPYSQEKLVVALKPDKNPDAMLAERKKLAALFSTELQVPVEIVVPVSGAVILEGLANGSIDLAYLSATDMVHARDSGAASLLLAGEIDGKTGYDSYWVVKKDAPYQTIEDLRGHPVAFASRSSTSGYLFPLMDLKQRGLVKDAHGLEEFFGPGGVWFGSGYVSAIERVLSGEAEAAAVSYYVLDGDKHLDADQRSALRMLQRQGPVPTHVLAISNRLSSSDRTALLELGLALNEPKNAALRDLVFTSKLIEVDEPAHLTPVAEALEIADRHQPRP